MRIMLLEDLNKGLQVHDKEMKLKHKYKMMSTYFKSVRLNISDRTQFIVKVFSTNIFQICLSMLMTALVFTSDSVHKRLLEEYWVVIILGVVSTVALIVAFVVQRFPNLRFLTD
ncbi:unnamed protein product, partial [Schistosoma turkestanicum]